MRRFEYFLGQRKFIDFNTEILLFSLLSEIESDNCENSINPIKSSFDHRKIF